MLGDLQVSCILTTILVCFFKACFFKGYGSGCLTEVYQNNLIIALLHHFQRDVPSAELVMVNRIFLADEKLALMKEKKMVLEGML